MDYESLEKQFTSPTYYKVVYRGEDDLMRKAANLTECFCSKREAQQCVGALTEEMGEGFDWIEVDEDLKEILDYEAQYYD